MAPSSARGEKGATRAYLWIAVVAVLLAAALSGAWYYMAGRLDMAVRSAIEAAGGQGVAIACENQSVFGYPFRIGLHCDALGIDSPERNFRAAGGELRTAAQIYRPTRVVAELDAPLTIAAEGAPPLDIRWTLAQASANFWTEGLDRFSLVMDAPDIALSDPAGARRPMVRSDRLEAHARRRGDSLDIAFTDVGIRALEPSLAALPAFDVAGDVTIDDAAGWLSGERPGRTLGEALAGKAGTIRTLSVAIAGATEGAASPASAAVSGPFSVAGDGEISGAFDVVLTDPAAIAGLLSALVPELEDIAGTIASGVAFAGKTENGRTTIRVDIEDGNASLGVIPLGRIAPLR